MIIIESIRFNNKVIGYIDDSREVSKYLPDNETLISFKTYGKKRSLLYPSGRFIIEPTDKVKGTGIGNICSICSIGTLQNQGGCAVCDCCQAAIKCGT